MKLLITILLIALPLLSFAQTGTIRRQHDVVTITFDKERLDKYGLNFKDLCKKIQHVCKSQLIRMDSNSAKCQCALFLKTTAEQNKKAENCRVKKVNGTPVFIRDIAVIGYQSGKYY